MLVKIYHKKLVTFGDKPLDIINNIISKDFDKVNPFTGSPVC